MITEGIWVVEPNKIEVRPVEIPDEPGFDEVQIEVKACGVCSWDAYLYQGLSSPSPLPYQIGHEAVGIIRKVGQAVTDLKPGDKVFVGSSQTSTMMGKFINNVARGVAKIPDDVKDFSKWVMEPACCVVNLLNSCSIMAGDSVVLVGAGYMGLLTLMGLTRGSQAGYITVFEKVEARRKLAEKLAPGCVYDPESQSGKEQIEKIKQAGGADLVIDFAASDSGYQLALNMVKTAGRFAIGSWHRHAMQFDGTQWHLGGTTVLNLSPMSNPNYHEVVPRTAVLVEKGVYTPWDLVTHVADYRECDEVFKKAISKEDGYIKGVIIFGE